MDGKIPAGYREILGVMQRVGRTVSLKFDPYLSPKAGRPVEATHQLLFCDDIR